MLVMEEKDGSSDLTFIVNQPDFTLKNRFEQLINDCKFFDCLVGYFFISGFYMIYKALETTEKIRILVGINTDPKTYQLIENEKAKIFNQVEFQYSHKEIQDKIECSIEKEITESDDIINVEEGIRKFIEFIKSGKLQIRVYPSQNIHAKLYIMTFKEGDRDRGRIITGSSNFTRYGLQDNLEFNVELKNRSDYEFAIKKFEELWKKSVDVTEKYVQTVTEKTWLNESITPYELYLKLLYEYFKDELSITDEIYSNYLPQDFIKFEYQEQAVLNSKKILEEYGGVFISDVVGLGKTYIAAMLASQLEGRTLVIASPALLNINNPGSWPNVFSDFNIPADYCSVGKLENAKNANDQRRYMNIIIDEAHRFRNETTISHEILSDICRGKRVILISATPYNNSPEDILSLIKLFQNSKKSTIPGIPNIEGFFNKYEKKLHDVDRQKGHHTYMDIIRENSIEIRNKVLKYLMVRRTRKEIEKYFADDLNKNEVKFPEIEDPQLFYYKLSTEEDITFMETLRLITKEFKYSRYTPLLYLSKDITPIVEQSQRNMHSFMKVLLVKRLESSFYAFKKSIDRFIHSNEMFIKEYEKGDVYLSKKLINKIFELLEQNDDEAVQKLIDEGKAEKYKSSDFKQEFVKDLKNDLDILKKIKSKWEGIQKDPKLEKLLYELENNPILRDKKIIIFTESKETAEYLKDKINEKFKNIALLFHGESSKGIRDKVIDNFDARAKNKKDDYRILISTEVLSEGVNLHRSNIVLNYDIPWNPTRLMQRVGRVNRINTQFDKIYTFNFFPSSQVEAEIDLTAIARSKIEAFLTLLGSDSSILTEGEPVSSYELFDKLSSKKTISEDDEEESELKYLKIIEKIRDEDKDLFEKIKSIPIKTRSAKYYSNSLKHYTDPASLITFFREGKLMKFFVSNKNNSSSKEIDFLTAVKIFDSSKYEKKATLPIESYYEFLDSNKKAFFSVTSNKEITDAFRQGPNSNTTNLTKILKATLKNGKQLTDEQEEYLKRVIDKLEGGEIHANKVQRALTNIKNLQMDMKNPLKVINILRNVIPEDSLRDHYSETFTSREGKREIILSLYIDKKLEDGKEYE